MYAAAVSSHNYKVVIFIDPRSVAEAIKKFYSIGAVRVHVDKTSKP